MKHYFLKLSLLIVAVVATQSAGAWGGGGHTVIAYAAEQLLEPEVKQKCRQYLGSTLTFQASWMDMYRSIKPYTECDEWHSTNIDAKGKVVRGVTTTGAFHIVRIYNEMKDGKYKQMSDSLVKINLQYLIHMIGDHHCPVHVRWDKTEHPEFHYRLKIKNKSIASHGFWDGSPHRWRKKWTADKYYANMQKLTPAQAKRVMKGDGYTWTQETANTARLCLDLTPAGSDIAQYTQEQKDAIHAVVDRQLQLAAYRLAGVLNDIFKH